MNNYFRNNVERLGIAVTLFAAVSYGLWPAALRIVYNEGANPTLAVIVSMSIRSLSMLAFCLITQRRLYQSREAIKQGIIGGIYQALTMWAIYQALKILPGPVAIIIIFSHTIMLLLFMAWRGEILLDRATVLLTLAALLGLSFVVDVWHNQAGSTWVGIAWAFAAALMSMSRLYMFGKQTQERHPIVVGAENFVVAALLLIPMIFVIEPALPTTRGWIWLVGGASASTLGTFGMFYAISLIGSFRYSLFLKMEPVFTSLFSVLLIHEILKPQQYVGMVLVLASLVTYQVLEHRKKTAAHAAQQLSATSEA